jgi:hypothetical protein
MSSKAPISGTETGTPAWAIKRLTEDGLVSLMNDLVDKEKDGLKEEQCEVVKGALQKLANQATEIPDGGILRPPLFKALEGFLDRYTDWNYHPEDPEVDPIQYRREALRVLRRQRHKIAKLKRKNYRIMNDELDLLFVVNMYKTLGEIPQALPGMFKGVGRALEDFLKRLPPGLGVT